MSNEAVDRFEEIKRAYNDEGTEALSPLDMHWLIWNVATLREIVAFQGRVLADLSDLPDGGNE